MTPIAVHPEGPRYARSLVYLPGLWTPAALMRPLASFLAHRGWAGLIADAEGGGDVARRAEEVRGMLRALDAPPVLVGHDAGGLVALAVAEQSPVAGVVWLAPIGPRPRALTRLLGTWRVAGALLRGRDLAPPRGAAAAALFGTAAPVGLREAESVRFVRDVLRAGPPRAPESSLPLALVAGAGDVLAREAALRGADALEVPAAGRWLLGGDAWRATAGVLHRWLVQRLGAENLELYEEAMADRQASDEE